MKLDHLKTFLKVIDTGSFSEAALELDTSQSVVSYAVMELEKELGVRLLERGRFGASPTDLGREIAATARQMAQLETAIAQQAGMATGAIRGTLRVATFRSVASQVVPSVITALRRDYPDLTVKLVEVEDDLRELDQLLREGLADVAFTTAPFPEELICWELLRDPYVVLVPKGHELAGRTVTRQDILASPLIFYENHKCAINVQNYLKDLPTGYTPSYQVKEDSTILSMVAQALGVSIVPALAFEDLTERVARAELADPLERRIGVAVLPTSLKIPMVRVFLNALKERLPDSDVPYFSLLQPGAAVDA